ncbi:MAG TPA: hypothetical protein VFS19_04490 [Planctomycetota bacterium]|nr:hypothetical protein [Planctomycetota bacterium]
MKPNIPLVLGAGVVVAGLAVLVLWQPEPQAKDLAAPAVERLRAEMKEKGKLEGKDYIFDEPAILRRDDQEMIVRIDVKYSTLEATQGSREYYRLLRTSDGWGFDKNLRRHFTDFAERERTPATSRLAQQLVERYQASVDIPGANVRIASRLSEGKETDPPEERILGYIDILFVDQGAESRYVEKYTLRKGVWTMEGTRGQLFDRGPRTPPR